MNAAPVIPIQNIYFLFCYAWDRFEEAQSISTGAETSPDLPNLLSRVLLNGMHSLFRRGLDRNYQSISEDLATVRGHIELGPSLKLYAKNIHRLVCEYDELTHDVLQNQILKATLKRLSSVVTIERELSREMQKMVRRLSDVSDIRLSQECFSRVKLHRNNAYYDLLLKIAFLAFDCLQPKPGGAGFVFQDVLRDEKKMAMVFESFVKNFYRLEQSEFKVEPLTIQWDGHAVQVEASGRLPQMRVDVFLRSPEREIIIDTKYYAEAMQSYYGSKSFKSNNLYQLYSYLKNYAPIAGREIKLDGMLIYPQVEGHIDARFDIQGHEVRLATLDLASEWRDIRERLLQLFATGNSP